MAEGRFYNLQLPRRFCAALKKLQGDMLHDVLIEALPATQILFLPAFLA